MSEPFFTVQDFTGCVHLVEDDGLRLITERANAKRDEVTEDLLETLAEVRDNFSQEFEFTTELQSQVTELRAALELVQLMAMDEDNLWDLKRADEIRSGIRDYAGAALERTNVGEQ